MQTTLNKDLNGLSTIHITQDIDGEHVPGHRYAFVTDESFQLLDFQSGPVKENGVNGITNEALLHILIHRTKELDSKFPCKENKQAITNMESALDMFNKRTTKRIEQGVEGTNKPSYDNFIEYIESLEKNLPEGQSLEFQTISGHKAELISRNAKISKEYDMVFLIKDYNSEGDDFIEWYDSSLFYSSQNGIVLDCDSGTDSPLSRSIIVRKEEK